MKKTKILCTIGPASLKSSTLKRMLDGGMNAFRINTAYGDVKEYEMILKKVWKVADIPAVLDLKGPEIRARCESEFEAKKGDIVEVGFKKSDPVSFNRNIYSQVVVGETVLLDKGRVKSEIISKSRGNIKLKLHGPVRFRTGLGVNMPGKHLSIPTLSVQDLAVVELAKSMGVDYVALSFTRNVNDIRNLKAKLKGHDIGVIAKIENREGIDNIDGIISECEGVMIARGDLGIEIPFQEIPLVQKDIIIRCNKLGKISIVATEMLHSMVENPLPTRAETSDVANAILDGADSVMLSAESAVGRYPVGSVKAMAQISLEVETHLPIKPLDEEVHDKVSMAISKAVTAVIETIQLDKIVVSTHTGYTAMLISNFKINKDIIAITDCRRVCRKLKLVYAVKPIYHKRFRDKLKIQEMAKFLAKEGLLHKKDMVLFTAGLYSKTATTNIVQLHRMKDLLEYRECG